MRSKTTLSFIEQIIMIAVFAAAAAVSLRVFVYADSLSKKNEARDFAVTAAQNAAECLKSTGGDMEAAAKLMNGESDAEGFTVRYNESFRETEEEAVYELRSTRRDSGSSGLGLAEIRVSGAQGELFSLLLYWQEGAE